MFNIPNLINYLISILELTDYYHFVVYFNYEIFKTCGLFTI